MLRWGLDWLLKAHYAPDKLVVQVCVLIRVLDFGWLMFFFFFGLNLAYNVDHTH